MKNLENFGVQELNATEVTKIEGGRNVLENIGYGLGYASGILFVSALNAVKIVMNK